MDVFCRVGTNSVHSAGPAARRPLEVGHRHLGERSGHRGWLCPQEEEAAEVFAPDPLEEDPDPPPSPAPLDPRDEEPDPPPSPALLDSPDDAAGEDGLLSPPDAAAGAVLAGWTELLDERLSFL